ncbi:uncharacterized protein LOC141632753 [Silene latifolia]|uniref:uncharacterized protein LOC141632753 n=1 Tax=Silene latifolia TaxID=37657 RepID=UPI003D77AB87
MGYPSGKKGWYLYDLDRWEFFVSRDVKFYEDQFPFMTTTDSRSCVNPPPSNSDDFVIDWDNVDDDTNDAATVGNGSVGDATPSTVETDTPPSSDFDTEDAPPPPPLGRGHRARILNKNLRDYVLDFGSDDSDDNSPSSASNLHVSSSTSGTPYPLANYLSCNKFSSPHRSYLATLMSHTEPRNFKEVVQRAGWRQAMETEMRALLDNKTWILEPLPPGKKALGSKWLYKIKYKSDSTIKRLKTRLVMFGNHQIEGVDYDETFAVVAKMTTVRTFLAVASAKNWYLHQMDVHNAFLHGD